ncbi:MAG: TIGR03960 family B12-binding radical SAM protein [Cyanobacteria bacterium]|nr:TIGR03960 family B12-binding radical SAM protein [Cyanobacteriota bacterium]
MIIDKLRNKILPQVQKPGQYLGNEWGAAHKDWDSAKSRMVLVYPDLYELGMSNFGLKLLYQIVNNHPDYLCDRAFAVMPDMEEMMRANEMPLWSWEANKPLAEFDFIGISLAYELCYTNVLNVLDLAGLPLKTKDRDLSHPLVFAGGPACFNPEPMAEYFDFFIIGDGEELILEIQAILIGHREKGIGNREELLYELAQLQGIYVPSLYELDENFIPQPIPSPVSPIPYPVLKRITQYLTDANNPISGPIPHIKTVQDKQVLEIRRGCDRGCRFCQVGYTYLPVRERSAEDLLRLSGESVKQSGYEDITLLSLSASDYTCLTEAAHAINDEHAQNGVGLSMPSQRADRFNVQLADEVSGARKSGMTFAPEAGTERMRRIINKGLSEAEIKRAIQGTYDKGWKQVKLYFMIGLPFEEDADLDGIIDILEWAANLHRSTGVDGKCRKAPLKITCTISTFVPKTFTAFQWFPQCSVAEFYRKQKYLRDGLRQRRVAKQIKLNCTEPELAMIESVLSRGDRRWGEVIQKLWETGSRMDSWSEHFNINRWQQVAAECGLNIEEEVSKDREPGSKQPWDVLTIGFTDKFLLHEWQQAVAEIETAPCTENKCHACGVCFNLNVKNIVGVDLSDSNPFIETLNQDERLADQDVLKQEWLIRAQKYHELLLFLDILVNTGMTVIEHVQRVSDRLPKIIVKNTVCKQRVKLKITKLGDYRFASHLDFQRLLERAFRRSGLPLVHTMGFNQRIKISWLSALSLFVESMGEYLIIELAEVFDDLDKLKEILNQELPEQARIVEVTVISSKERLSLEDVLETVYTAKLIQDDELFSQNNDLGNTDKDEFQQKLDQRLTTFLDQREIVVTGVKKDPRGKGQSKNIRDNIIDMQFLDSEQLELRLRSTQRPDEVLNAFLTKSKWSICKQEQVFKTTKTSELV